jgi:glycosyltransferase involved in cell wall biosynthesis
VPVTTATVDYDELGRRLLVEPLCARLHTSSVLVCTGEADDVSALLASRPRTEPPDVVWLRGALTWHSLRKLETVVVEHCDRRSGALPLVVVEIAEPAHLEPQGAAAAQTGVRLALEVLGARIDPGGTTLWWSPGRGIGVFVPSARAEPIEAWLAERRLVLDMAAALSFDNAAADAHALALFELLDQSQHNALELVRSLRFRVGTRVVRLGRKALRKERPFRAPLEIIARAPRVESWRTRLAQRHADESVVVPGGARRVTFVVPELRLSGGVLAVLQLVVALRRLGTDARVVALKDRRRELFPWRVTTSPAVYDGAAAALRRMAPADIVVATHWTTADVARAAVDNGRARHAAYFVQDYEPWFHDEDDLEARRRVRATYAAISHRIVTSDWLREKLAADGFDAVTVALGVDLGFFYPRPHPAAGRPQVLAMARPRTPRRGFDTLVATLTKVHEEMPGADIVLFGEDLGDLRLPFPFAAKGLVSDRQELAASFSAAHTYIDVSDYQAFGLPALEAMACGTPCVVTEVGGVHEYARHEENCLLVPPHDADAAASAAVRVLTDDELHRSLRTGALTTASRHGIRRAAQHLIEVFEKVDASAP